MSFDGLFRKDRPNKARQRTAAGMAVFLPKSQSSIKYSLLWRRLDGLSFSLDDK